MPTNRRIPADGHRVLVDRVPRGGALTDHARSRIQRDEGPGSCCNGSVMLHRPSRASVSSDASRRSWTEPTKPRSEVTSSGRPPPLRHILVALRARVDLCVATTARAFPGEVDRGCVVCHGYCRAKPTSLGEGRVRERLHAPGSWARDSLRYTALRRLHARPPYPSLVPACPWHRCSRRRAHDLTRRTRDPHCDAHTTPQPRPRLSANAAQPYFPPIARSESVDSGLALAEISTRNRASDWLPR